MVLETFMDHTEKDESARIVPVRLCCMQSITDRCYLPGDKSTEVQRRTQPRKNSVTFVQISSPDSASELKNNWVIAVKTHRNIDTGEKLYLKHGSEYSFP